MPKDRETEYPEDEFSLDAILAEFGSGKTEEARREEPPAAPFDAPTEETPTRGEPPAPIPFPSRPEVPAGTEAPPSEAEEEVYLEARGDPQSVDRLMEDDGEDPEEDQPSPQEGKVLEFPGAQPENPVSAGIDKLRRRADEFADHMFEEAGAETAKSVRRAERLIPGVDEEEPAPPPVRERKPRKVLPPPPDIPPADLAKRYGKGIKGIRLRTFFIFFLLLPLLALTLAAPSSLPFPGEIETLLKDKAMVCYLMAGLQGLAMLLGLDAIWEGLTRPFRRRTGMDTLIALAMVATLADALTLPTLTEGDIHRQPFCAVAVLGLWCLMRGRLQKRRGQRLACRTAAAASEPYLVTPDEGKWNGRDTYAKWSGPVTGFGSQIQAEDGAEAIYRVMVPLLTLAAVLLALIASVGHDRPRDLLWCLAATLTAAGSLSATLCFGLPWRRLSARLSKSGAALAGWQGVTNTTGTSNLLLSDIDLFPVGSVSLNGVKIFGDFPTEMVIADTATVIRDGGSALEKVFHDLLRSQGGIYRRGEKLTAHEGGGLSEIIRGNQVLVGSAPFMVLMDVALPSGLNVKNAVFCAIDGELAGIFALNYHLPGTVPAAIDSLIHNKITPVLATRDFNIIPAMLRQRFKLPAEKLEFPSVERRRELSDPNQTHSDTLTAVLCREGLGPYAEAVVGGRRLRSAVRLSAGLACVGSVIGILLAFYLTFIGAYASLTPGNMMVFLLMWLVPTPLIAGWVDRY